LSTQFPNRRLLVTRNTPLPVSRMVFLTFFPSAIFFFLHNLLTSFWVGEGFWELPGEVFFRFFSPKGPRAARFFPPQGQLLIRCRVLLLFVLLLGFLTKGPFLFLVVWQTASFSCLGKFRSFFLKRFPFFNLFSVGFSVIKQAPFLN